MKSNFWVKSVVDGLHDPREMGIRFWRKSPERGFMVRQRLVEDFIVADEKARVAVLSRGLDSAAAEGLRTPPAPEMGRADVGFAVNPDPEATAAAVVMVEDAEEVASVARVELELAGQA